VKCPKCSYLGFETGDRCKNCGYDFSLMAPGPGPTPAADFTIRADDVDANALDLRLDGTPSEPAMTPEEPLPLFDPDAPDDPPLITLPVAPRPPLAVRRTPDSPRLRAVPKMKRAVTVEPALNFRDEAFDPDAIEPDRQASEPTQREAPSVPRTTRVDGRREVGIRRLFAATIDHVILLAIDLGIVYFTLRIAGLEASDLRMLPVAPLVTFIALLKFAYFTSFTAVGGQTIGKMASGIRVVAEEGTIDSGRALRRTCAGVLSLLTLGLGFLPAFFGADRRTLHDRLTHTRVVGLPSA